ncbi:hypothetical protein C8Q77DRAFT_1149348 [Trametes polyzona]|nr:hypothetical protein C8Q77DRAFT_1149348 [Trametes polyzona]
MHLLSFSNIILAGIFAVHGALAAGAGVSPSLSLDRPRGYRFGKPVAPHPAAPIHGGGPDVYRPDYKESGGAVASTIHILDNPYLPLQPASDEDHPGSVLASNLAPEDPTIANGARFTAPALARTREVSPDVEGLIGGCKKMSGKVAVTQVTTGLTVGFLAFNPYQVLFPDSTTAFLMDTVGYTMRASDIVSFTACPDKPFTASVFVSSRALLQGCYSSTTRIISSRGCVVPQS